MHKKKDSIACLEWQVMLSFDWLKVMLEPSIQIVSYTVSKNFYEVFSTKPWRSLESLSIFEYNFKDTIILKE